MKELKIGIIGTDTSHAVSFACIINDINNPLHVPGGKIVVAFPGGSPDFPLSITSGEEFMERLNNGRHLQLIFKQASSPSMQA
jgi:hypothetical protein